MARGLGLLFAAGATLGAVTLVLPHRADEAQAELLIPVGLAYVAAPLLLTFADRCSPRLLSAALGAGSALIALAVVWGGPAGGIYAFMFVWVALYAAAFFGPREAAAHVAWAMTAYGVVLFATEEVRPPAGAWLMATGTCAVSAGLILVLTRELRARARDLAAVTALANEIGSASEVSAQHLADRICEAVQASVGARSVELLEELPDGSGLHELGASGVPTSHFADPAAVTVLDRAYRGGRTAELVLSHGQSAVVEPVRRDGRIAGLLVVEWERPRRRAMRQRVAQSIALFAAEAGVALERIAHQRRDRERRALELNDEIVQGLVVAKYALREGHVESSERALDETLGRARALVDSQLGELYGKRAPEPGSLRVLGRRA
jgi:hypothetical protein